MSRVCALTGLRPQVGCNVSHANNRSKKRFMPNLRSLSLQSVALGQTFRLRISRRTLRSIDKMGGLDAFLLGSSESALTPVGCAMRRRLLRLSSKTD